MSDKTARLREANLRFARSATRHRISKDSIRYVIANHSVRFEEPPPPGRPGARSVRIVFLGDDAQGNAMEVMTVQLAEVQLLVIHAMALREKYRTRYEEAQRWRR